MTTPEDPRIPRASESPAMGPETPVAPTVPAIPRSLPEGPGAAPQTVPVSETTRPARPRQAGWMLVILIGIIWAGVILDWVLLYEIGLAFSELGKRLFFVLAFAGALGLAYAAVRFAHGPSERGLFGPKRHA